MRLSDNMIEHLKQEAEKIEHGEIIIKFNGTQQFIDVKAGNTKRFKEEEDGFKGDKESEVREG